MKRILMRAVLGLIAAAAIVYVGDAAVLFVRMGQNNLGAGPAFGTVTFYYTADLKSHQYEIFEQPQTETCVRAIFPHYGYSPCWYSRRRTMRTVG
jgi:hypothetical protein